VELHDAEDLVRGFAPAAQCLKRHTQGRAPRTNFAAGRDRLARLVGADDVRCEPEQDASGYDRQSGERVPRLRPDPTCPCGCPLVSEGIGAFHG